MTPKTQELKRGSPSPKRQSSSPSVQGTRCAFCDATEDLQRCSWPVLKPGVIHHTQLREDDTIVTQGGRELKPLGLHRFDAELAGGLFPVTMYGLHYGRDQYWVFYQHDRKKQLRGIRVLMDAPCEKACCPLHRADRDADVTCCMEHWQAWRAVA